MATLINTLRKRITGRILRSLAVFGSVEVLTMCCNVVRTKLIALWVGTAGVGLMGLFSTALDMIAQLTQLSLRTVTVRDIAAAGASGRRHAISRSVALYGTLLAVAGAALTALLAPALSALTFGNLGYTWAFAALAIAVAANTFTATQSAILQGHGHLRRIALASIIGVPASLAIAIPMVYYWRIHSIIRIIIVYTLVMAALFFILRFRSDADARRIAGTERRQLWGSFARLGIYLSLASAFTYAASYLLMSYINHRSGTSEMGLYQAGYSLSVRYIGIIFPAMAMEYYPRLAGVDSPWRTSVMMSRQTSVSIAVVVPCAAAMILLAPWIVRLLYTGSFLTVVPMVIFAAASLPLRAWAWSMGFVLLARGNGRIYLTVETLSAAAGTILNIAGYTLAGLTGLGISFILWYALDCLVEVIVLRRCYRVTTAPRVASLALISSAALLALGLAIFCWRNVVI